MPKKRKLNSTNPKWIKKDEKSIKIRKDFIADIKGVKISTIYYI